MFLLFVFVYVHITMSNIAGVLQVNGAAYHSRAHEFFVGERRGKLRVAHPFTFLCCVVCFIYLHHVSCAPNVASVAGFSFPDCTFGFL